MDPTMRDAREAAREASAREIAEAANGQGGQGGQGSAHDESPGDQVLIPASLLEDILRQQQQLNDAIRAITQVREVSAPRTTTGRTGTLPGETRPHVQPRDHLVENEVEYVPENVVEKEPDYQQGVNDMQPRTSQVPPAQTSEYVTKDDLRKILEAKRECVADIDFRPPYPQWIAAKPYPKGYQPSQFRKFDGQNGNAREHVMCFIDDLGVFGQNKELRLREFSKSLTGKAYTWYTKLTPESIHSWEEMAVAFCGKFFESHATVHIMDLGRIRQRPGEDTISFIKRYRDLALECKESMPEADLVYGCVTNMDGAVRLFLEQAKIPTFAELIDRAQRTVLSIRKANSKKAKRPREEGVPLMSVAAVEEPRLQTPNQQNTKRQYNRVPPPTIYEAEGGSRPPSWRGRPPPPFPCPMEDVYALLEMWIRDGNIELPKIRHQVTEADRKSARFCRFH